MNEWTKSLAFIVAAVVMLAIGWWAGSATIDRKAVDDTGTPFFDQFDPLTAKSLEIMSIDPDTSAPRNFKVAQQSGIWSIPSRENYPADAQSRLAQAATSVMGLTKGPTKSDSPKDHQLYGVADPASGATEDQGTGTRVTLRDEGGKVLVDFIIGKEVKDSAGLRYVRVPGRDRVYASKVTVDQLSTKFEDWIERDLLKMAGAQVKEVVVEDYSIDEINQRIVKGDRMLLRYDLKKNSWSLDGIAEDEVLQTEPVTEMRIALNDLKIVDVHRKPAGLSKQLSGGMDLQLDPEAVTSLSSCGYYVVRNQLLSNEGEMFVRTSDGVEYSLRFGEVVHYDAGSAVATQPQSESTPETPESGPGRYVFVVTTFDESLVEQPEYEVVPDPVPASQPDASTDGAAASQPAAPPVNDAERKRITRENESKRLAYEKKVADGREKVKELNARFAEWYYVVPDSVYQKLRLKRGFLVKEAVVEPTTQPQDGSADAPPVTPGLHQ